MDENIWEVTEKLPLRKKEQFPEETHVPSYQVSQHEWRSSLPLLGDLKALKPSNSKPGRVNKYSDPGTKLANNDEA